MEKEEYKNLLQNFLKYLEKFREAVKKYQDKYHPDHNKFLIKEITSFGIEGTFDEYYKDEDDEEHESMIMFLEVPFDIITDKGFESFCKRTDERIEMKKRFFDRKR